MRRVLFIAIPGLIVVLLIVGVSALATLRGFEVALPGRVLSFPRDHAAHPAFQTEWWYYTGHLRTADGEEYGYQLTFFQRRVDEGNLLSGRSQWAPQHLDMAHFAISDKQRKRLIFAEKSNRPTLGTAGADEERLHIWNDDWRAELLGPYHHLQAAMDGLAINLILSPEKPPVIHGTNGVFQKGPAKGNASHYYSLTRLKTDGYLHLRGVAKTVTGISWMDHEFGTSQLGPTQVGWDWMTLQLDNRSELMVYLLRHEDGRVDANSGATLVHPDGRTERLKRDQFEVVALGQWTSPRSGVVYPQSWEVRAPTAGLNLRITPTFADHELDTKNSTWMVYWAGNVLVEGVQNSQAVGGAGYVELVGYKMKVNL
jgi:predicted secreted hydrolase